MIFENNTRIAIATSGGPDSMTLLHLLSRVAHVVAVTVEHGLRAESLAEAHAVGVWCKKHKIEHHILTWHGAKPKTAVHESARAARYELLENFCYEHKILHLATAHHADDQAETILQRIAKASGPAGLSGMTEHSFTPHLHLWRPLLGVPKKELVAYCKENEIPFVCDPSNKNEKYARGRLRGAADVLAAEGLTPENLNLLAQKQRAVTAAIESQAAKFLSTDARLLPNARAEILTHAFGGQPYAVQQTVLDYLLKLISGHPAPIRYDSLASLCATVTADRFGAKTLGHCRIASKKIRKENFILITPESPQT